MSERAEVTPQNIALFIEGNSKYYYDKFFGLSAHIREQVAYRLITCFDTCVQKGKCSKCFCDLPEKAYTVKPCSDKFPPLMEALEWEQYKKDRNIVLNEKDLSRIKSYLYNTGKS